MASANPPAPPARWNHDGKVRLKHNRQPMASKNENLPVK